MNNVDFWILIATLVQSTLIAIIIVMIRQEDKKKPRHSH